MPRLSLYRPEKGNDFKFIDRAISQQFQIGGTDIFVHKYLGPVAPTAGNATPTTPTNVTPISELGIQDVLLMENRDRNYDPDIYSMRGIYTMQDIDFNLTQFGFFLQNDNIMITFHLKDCIDKLGRKLMSGDVVELPHLKDEYALDDSSVALKRFYVITDVARAATGYSQTWYPHLLRAKCQPIVDSQEFAQIFDQNAGAGDYSNSTSTNTLRDLLSTYNQSLQVNNAVLAQAELDAPLSGFDTKNLFVIPQKSDGTVDREDASMTDVDVSTEYLDASVVLKSPTEDIYSVYLSDDGIPPNGAPYTHGIQFPVNPVQGQFHLRTDFLPNRLFRYDGASWVKYEDNIRMTLSNSYDPATAGNQDTSQIQDLTRTRKTLKSGFINNDSTATIAGKVIRQRQSLSKALKPQADN